MLKSRGIIEQSTEDRLMMAFGNKMKEEVWCEYTWSIDIGARDFRGADLHRQSSEQKMSYPLLQ